MSRRVSKAESAAIGALIVGAIMLAGSVLLILAKSLWFALKWIGQVAGDLFSDNALRRHQALLKIVSVASAFVFVGALAAIEWYWNRSEWHVRYARGTIAFGIGAFGIATSCSWLMWRRVVKNKSPAEWVRLAPVALSFTSLVAMAACVFGDRPSLEAARFALQHGDLNRAQIEAASIHELSGSQQPATERVLDDIHLAALRNNTNLDQQLWSLSQSWFSAQARQQASLVLTTRIGRMADDAVRQSDVAALDRLISASSTAQLESTRRLRAQRALVLVGAYDGAVGSECPSAALSDLQGAAVEPGALVAAKQRVRDQVLPRIATIVRAVAQAHDPAEKLGPLQHAVALSDCFHALTGEDTQPTANEFRQNLANAISAAQRTQAAVVAAPRREYVEPTSSDQGHRSAYLLCRDGTTSPSCRCDRASYRGCCSRHGGVDSCSE